MLAFASYIKKIDKFIQKVKNM